MPEDTSPDRKDRNVASSHAVRLYEANCSLPFPSDNDIRFRDALSNLFVRELHLVVKAAPSVPAQTPTGRG